VRKAVTAFQHAVPRSSAANVDVAIVRVAHEAVAATFQLAVQVIEQLIREQRPQRAALRLPFVGRTGHSCDAKQLARLLP